VENDGGNTPAGDEEVDPTANVVDFPGDWFGPREDLVPFGPRASESGSGGADEPGVAQPTPVRAEDFWGEQSWSMHDAMAGPEAGRPELEPEVSSRRRPARPRVRSPPARVRLPRARAPQLGRRPAMVAAGVAFACLLVASVVGSIWSGAVPASRGGHDAAALSPAVIAPAVPPITTARVKPRPASRRRLATRRRSTSHPKHARARVNRVGSAGARASSGVTVASASGSSQSATQSSASSDQSSSAASSGTGATPVSSTTNSSGGSGGSGGSSRASGPVGPGAPFGPGHLG
jgi:hypothetical protein